MAHLLTKKRLTTLTRMRIAACGETKRDSEREGRRNCALCFVGLPRCTQSIALPAIKKHILSLNPNCDTYYHTINITSHSN